MVLTRSQIQQLRMAPRARSPQIENTKIKPNAKSWLNRFSPVGLIKRSDSGALTPARILRGGRLSDLGRFPRYGLIGALGFAAIWMPAIAYIKYGAVSYKSHFALILPGAGSNASVNISEIGQATSNSTSPFSSSSISPTVTYKNLLMSANVVNAAAKTLNRDPNTLSVPVVKLVDETSFITVEMNGNTSESARDNAIAIKDAFFAQLKILRDDELKRREDSISETVKKYGSEVNLVRSRYNELQISSGLNSIDQYNTIVNANENLKVKLADNESTLAKVEESYSSLNKSLGLSPEAMAITMRLHADPEFTVLVDATAKGEADYAQASEQFGSNHPKLVDARNKYEGLKKKMLGRAIAITGLPLKSLGRQIDFSSAGQRSALMTQLIDFETEKRGLEAQNSTLRSQFETQQRYIASMAPIVSKMENINRDYKLAEAVFTSALGRISTSKSDIFASYPMAQVIEPPVMPLAPSTPNKNLAVGAASAATVLLLFASFLGWIRRPLIDKLLVRNIRPDEKPDTP
jgi:uncharacterized protein involved in exopolysaccharide biosynthesis